MIDLVIREYTPADRAGVIALARQLQAKEASLYDRMKPPEAIDGWYLDDLLEACEKAKGTLFVAEVGEKLVGYATLLTRLTSTDEIEEVEYTYAKVKDLAVDEDHRRGGIGRALLARCEETARQAGARWLRLTVISDNDAVHLYDKAGFKALFTEMEKPLE